MCSWSPTVGWSCSRPAIADSTGRPKSGELYCCFGGKQWCALFGINIFSFFHNTENCMEKATCSCGVLKPSGHVVCRPLVMWSTKLSDVLL